MRPPARRSLRFLGVGETCDLGALYLSLQREGHAVKVAVSEPLAVGTLAGSGIFPALRGTGRANGGAHHQAR